LTQKKRLLIYAITVFIGWITFFSFNISYALLTLRSFVAISKTIILFVPLIFLIAFVTAAWVLARSYEKRPSKIKSIISLGFIVILGGWTLLSSVLYFSEHHVLYTNSPVSKKYYKKIQQQDDFEKILITTTDGITLQGYLFKNEDKEKAPLSIYFGGRGEEASAIVEYASRIKGQSLAFINYRGCGLSTGKQCQESLCTDASEIYDYFASRDDIDENNISLIGHSLGTGVAVHLAAQRKVKSIVLSTPYDKYTAGVIGDRVPLMPVGRLLSDELDSLSLAPKVDVPALFLLAEEDMVVLRHRSIRLFNSWGGEAQKFIIKDTHHRNIITNKVTWDKINKFLDAATKE
jgi:uncharacterized protein